MALNCHAEASIREISNRYCHNLSQDFYKKVEIVLDRSRFNRIISHTVDCKGYWIRFEGPFVARFGRRVLFIWPYLPAYAPPVGIVGIDGSHARQPPDLPDPARDVFRLAGPKDRRGPSLLNA